MILFLVAWWELTRLFMFFVLSILGRFWPFFVLFSDTMLVVSGALAVRGCCGTVSISFTIRLDASINFFVVFIVFSAAVIMVSDGRNIFIGCFLNEKFFLVWMLATLEMAWGRGFWGGGSWPRSFSFFTLRFMMLKLTLWWSLMSPILFWTFFGLFRMIALSPSFFLLYLKTYRLQLSFFTISLCTCHVLIELCQGFNSYWCLFLNYFWLNNCWKLNDHPLGSCFWTWRHCARSWWIFFICIYWILFLSHAAICVIILAQLCFQIDLHNDFIFRELFLKCILEDRLLLLLNQKRLRSLLKLWSKCDWYTHYDLC